MKPERNELKFVLDLTFGLSWSYESVMVLLKHTAAVKFSERLTGLVVKKQTNKQTNSKNNGPFLESNTAS